MSLATRRLASGTDPVSTETLGTPSLLGNRVASRSAIAAWLSLYAHTHDPVHYTWRTMHEELAKVLSWPGQEMGLRKSWTMSDPFRPFEFQPLMSTLQPLLTLPLQHVLTLTGARRSFARVD